MTANPIRPDVGPFARSLARRRDRAALATIQEGEGLDGMPYASLVLVAFDLDASPLFYLSDLAQHAKNLKSDARASLLLDSAAPGPDLLAAPRVTLLGEVRPAADPRRLARFRARHPSILPYAGFRDFRLYRMAVSRAHLVAGFGRIAWIDGADFLFAGDPGALAAAEAALVCELNERHAALLVRCALRLAGGAGGEWRATGIDPEGLDLRHQGETARLEFAAPAATPEAARAALRDIAKAAGWTGPI
ncbi:MAG TPA: pyridoxamine 5'-phosphate oxidase family protein [Stellaceae bacterium]|nr:pyridoxamine 5'-phosphate oxidase family protein [Stellaceae bacterium]